MLLTIIHESIYVSVNVVSSYFTSSVVELSINLSNALSFITEIYKQTEKAEAEISCVCCGFFFLKCLC